MAAKRGVQDWIVLVSAIMGLAVIYIFQRVSYTQFFFDTLGLAAPTAQVTFVLDKTVRMVANDLLCLVIIHVWFADAKVTRLAWWVFIFELVIVLPVYLLAKLWLEGPTELSVPWLQQLHRLIINPLLMGLLMVSLLYQSNRK